HEEREHAGDQHAHRYRKSAETIRVIDVARVHITVVDSESQNQDHLGDEEQAKEERKPAQSLLVPLLKREVVDVIGGSAQRIECGQCHDGNDDGIDAVFGIENVGDIGADDDEARMGDVDDVQDAEGDRDADSYGGVESAKQQSRDQRVQK